jgi:hypothetical protein
MSAIGQREDEETQLFDDVASQAPQQDGAESPEAMDDVDPKERVKQAASGVLNRLSGLAQEMESAKRQIEERWFVDLAQFHGVYDDATRAKIDAAGGSKLFANQTRPKTTAWAARFGDMLFPTDDKNWGIMPTPVPSLAGGDASIRAMKMARAANDAEQAGDPQQAQQAVDAGQQAGQQHKQQQAEKDEADEKCQQMDKLIDDQLTECNYNIRSRESIMDACKLGTGIMKGPVLGIKTRRSWMTRMIQSTKMWGIKDAEDPRPGYVRVDPWNFFPDSAATTVEDAEFTFERHLPNKRELAKWRKKPGFIKENIDAMLRLDPRGNMPDYLNRLRTITGTDNIALDKNYKVWEYHGGISTEEMVALCQAQDDQQLEQIVTQMGGEDVQVILWFSDEGMLLRYGLHPLESGDTLYSVFNFDKDETSMWGNGVPYLMRDPQQAFSAAWRMMMDNGALSSGPQIIINKDKIVPENGDWKLAPRKVWVRTADSLQNQQPDFEVKDIQCNINDLQSILTIGKGFIDDETLLPPIAYGESGSHITKTAQGISMLMNAVNVIFRFVVKNWDDQMTVPNIQRLYDWNMQFSNDEQVKGDFDVQARGSSVLLVREIQSQNLMTLAANFSAHPIFGPMLKMIPLFRKLVASFLINPDEVVKDEDTYIKDLKAQADAAKNAPNPELDMKLKLEAQKHQFKMEELEAQAKLVLAEVAAKANVSLQEIKLGLASKERLFAAEAALTPAATSGGGGNL